MDADEFMMHGFDSDVSVGDDGQENEEDCLTAVVQTSSNQKKKYATPNLYFCHNRFDKILLLKIGVLANLRSGSIFVSL